MSETKHTPLPWRFVPWRIEEGPSAVRAPEGWLICSTSSDGDAEFIVEAVNSHASLVEENRRLREDAPPSVLVLEAGLKAVSNYRKHSMLDADENAAAMERIAQAALDAIVATPKPEATEGGAHKKGDLFELLQAAYRRGVDFASEHLDVSDDAYTAMWEFVPKAAYDYADKVTSADKEGSDA